MAKKNKKSTILRGMTRDGSARFLIINSTEMVNEMVKMHKTLPTATAAMGRLITASSMIGTLLPEKNNTVTVQTSTDGIISSMVAVSDYYGNVKSYMRGTDADPPRKSNGKLDVGGAVGKGYIALIRDLGTGDVQSGTTEIVTGEIAEDLASYFANSEQIPTLLSLGVLVDIDYSCKAAGGVLIQLMPYPDDNTVTLLERNAADLQSISRIIDAGKTNFDIAEIALRDIPFDVFDTLEVEYKCDCSFRRVRKKLKALGKEQVIGLFDDQEKEGKPRELQTVCRFCGKEYTFTEKDFFKEETGSEE